MAGAGNGQRRVQILQALAAELEQQPGSRITTARLAAVLEVSEAALYRHFPSKAKMFEALIEFAESTLFGLVSRIVAEQTGVRESVARIVVASLTFAARNPGITRILVGDALVGEHERLRERVAHLFDRMETQVRQLLREAELREGLRTSVPVPVAARVTLAVIEGSMMRFVRSRFKALPDAGVEELCTSLEGGIFPARVVFVRP